MAEIREQVTIAAFIGNPIRREALLRCDPLRETGSGSYADCTEYRISLPALADHPELAAAFGITAEQAEAWQRECVDFRLNIYEKNGRLVGGHISKRQRTELLPGGYETEPLSEDLSVIRRVLQAITKPAQGGENDHEPIAESFSA